MNSSKNTEKKAGTLFIVSTPIGNDEDITLRALKVLRSVDIVVCEEPKVGARTLHKYNLSQKMELLNEQNELSKTDELIELLERGKDLALICDGGTPVFADPGLHLVQSCIKRDIPIRVIPGVSALMTAIVRCGFPINQFLFAGFLSRKKEERFLQLRRLSTEERTVVLFETPYRLVPLLETAVKIMPERKAYIGCNLTMPYETHHYGTFKELYEKFVNSKFKGEFVVCFDSSTSPITPSASSIPKVDFEFASLTSSSKTSRKQKQFKRRTKSDLNLKLLTSTKRRKPKKKNKR
ncbi:MAG: 16S rRNA (cytidine(1402)-2'-O)-methyltransferase [Ignavibacteria bacterium]|nr:16S rRNA (cytidine(1402)-2'-O)-methyltransferase [Ignavibacteria bacterium]